MLEVTQMSDETPEQPDPKEVKLNEMYEEVENRLGYDPRTLKEIAEDSSIGSFEADDSTRPHDPKSSPTQVSPLATHAQWLREAADYLVELACEDGISDEQSGKRLEYGIKLHLKADNLMPRGDYSPDRMQEIPVPGTLTEAPARAATERTGSPISGYTLRNHTLDDRVKG